MHSNTKLTNALLCVIAICLSLIVLRLYGISMPVTTANAAEVVATQPVQVSNVPLPVRLVGALLAGPKARLAAACCRWRGAADTAVTRRPPSKASVPPWHPSAT